MAVFVRVSIKCDTYYSAVSRCFRIRSDFARPLYSHWTRGCILVKSESRKAVFGGMTYSSPIRVTTEAQAELFSVTRENKSTCDVEPSSATSRWAHSSGSSTRGSSFAISQRAVKPHSSEGRGSWTASVPEFRYPRDWAASAKDLVPFRITDLICIRTHYTDYSVWAMNNTKTINTLNQCRQRQNQTNMNQGLGRCSFTFTLHLFDRSSINLHNSILSWIKKQLVAPQKEKINKQITYLVFKSLTSQFN